MNEKICGFTVLSFPKKPDFVPLSDEDFKRETLSAWCRGGEREKITAALRGGEHEWAVLYRDESPYVRAAVICKASEAIQMKMLHGPEPVVRQWLVIYGTDRVRLALLEQHEHSPEVLVELAKWGNMRARNRIIPLAWDKADVLCKIAPYLGVHGLRLLEKHPDINVRFAAAMHGSLGMARRFLDFLKGRENAESWLMADGLSERIEDLERVESALLGGRVRNINLGVER